MTSGEAAGAGGSWGTLLCPSRPLSSSPLGPTTLLPLVGAGRATIMARGGAPRQAQWADLYLPPLVKLAAHPDALPTAAWEGSLVPRPGPVLYLPNSELSAPQRRI